MGNADDTVIIDPRSRRRRGPGRGVWLACGAGLLLVVGAGAAFWVSRGPAGGAVAPAAPRVVAPLAPPVPPPPAASLQAPVIPPIGAAAEAAILGEAVAEPTLLRFAPNPAILVLDFPDLASQARMLNRVAALVEKAGAPHDRLLSDTELASAIQASGSTPENYYYGHDYRGADISRFFALADRDRVALSADEEALRRMMRRAAAEAAGFGALITLPRAGGGSPITPQARATILHHELSHGEYFTNPAYAAFVGTVWNGVLTEDERAKFRTYLAGEGYDPALEDVMVNEMQAYLMHTPDPVYFDPGKLGITPGRLTQIRAGFLAAMPAGWLKDETPRP